ncbi:hypothetical protein CLCR_08699 [Cladophialophora carrionii]|uniref:Uncharacterized protein n=1 Tax=Cladophialophora carrionii TaxID=86049 RepID=A0A1C1CRY6_9EURO|nr:hypothetical protein CLCR_08699 [Cladophialophora carrionii]
MCRREVESWSCGCEVGVTKPCDYPTLACRSAAFFTPRLDHPYTCADCSQQSFRTDHGRAGAANSPMTSPGKKRSSSQAQNDDPRAYAQRVMEKRFSRPADLDLNLSLPPKRSRTSLQKWSSDAPQHIGRRNNTFVPADYGYGYGDSSDGDIDIDMSSSLANPAQDLASIAMPGALPAAHSPSDSHRPVSSGTLRRIGSVVTRRPTKRSPTYPDSPISPQSTIGPRSARSPRSTRSPRSPDTMRRISPRQIPTPYTEPRHQQHQYQYQQYQQPRYQAHQAHQAQHQHQPQQHQVHFNHIFDGHASYAAMKDSVEREIYSGQWTRAQIQAWHRFNMLKVQDQYELLHTYADSMAAPPPTQQAVEAMQSRKKAKPVGRSKKYPTWRSWANWFGWRK